MNDAAPDAVPVPVLEEAFARTMSARQVAGLPVGAVGAPLGAIHGVSRCCRARGDGRAPCRRPRLRGARRRLGLRAGTERPSPPRRRHLAAASSSPPSTPSPTATPSPRPRSCPPPASRSVGPSRSRSDGKAVWCSCPRPASCSGSTRRRTRPGRASRLGATTDLYNGIAVDRERRLGRPTGTRPRSTGSTRPPRRSSRRSRSVSRRRASLRPARPCGWPTPTTGRCCRIDPATNKVVATITVGPTGNSGPNWLASGFGSVWVGIPNNGTVVRIDAITNAIQATIPIPPTIASPCGGFAVTPTAVWSMPCDGPQAMTRIDPETNTVVTAVKLARAGLQPCRHRRRAMGVDLHWRRQARPSGPDLRGDQRGRSRAGTGRDVRGWWRHGRGVGLRLGHRWRERPCPSAAADRLPAADRLRGGPRSELDRIGPRRASWHQPAPTRHRCRSAASHPGGPVKLRKRSLLLSVGLGGHPRRSRPRAGLGELSGQAQRPDRVRRPGGRWQLQHLLRQPRRQGPEAAHPGLRQPPLPAFSADGRTIAYCSDVSGAWEIWTMHAERHEPAPADPPRRLRDLPGLLAGRKDDRLRRDRGRR